MTTLLDKWQTNRREGDGYVIVPVSEDRAELIADSGDGRQCMRGHDWEAHKKENGARNRSNFVCGLCQKFRWDGDLVKLCGVPTCYNPMKHGPTGLCCTHKCRLDRGDDLEAPVTSFAYCAQDNCHARPTHRGLCGEHILDFLSGKIATLGRAGSLTTEGYVEFVYYDQSGARIRVLEHRWVMELLLGRSLAEHEEVHHKNTIKTDNRPSNLELWSGSQPSGGRVEDKIAWAIEFLTEYGYSVEQEA